MIDIREILVRIFSAIFLSMCTGSCMFVFWMALRKFFADKIRPKVYDLILKIILIAYYVPAGYLLVNIFFDNGYVFDFTGTIIKAFYAISLFWLAGAIATVLKFGERTFRIRREKERCFPCKMYVQKIFEDCKRELGIRRSIEVLQGFIEPTAIKDAKPQDKFQMVRNGFFNVDPKYTTPEKLVFNRIVSLKSSFKLNK